IQKLLGGLATRLDGPLGSNQLCYTGPAKDSPKYDPARSRGLLAAAGFGNGGADIEFYTADGRYISDAQIGQAIAQMLNKVGFRVKLHAPEWASYWSDIRAGKLPMFYMG